MSASVVRSLLAAAAALCALPSAANATPLMVAGFTFEAGEQAFADDQHIVPTGYWGSSLYSLRHTDRVSTGLREGIGVGRENRRRFRGFGETGIPDSEPETAVMGRPQRFRRRLSL